MSSDSLLHLHMLYFFLTQSSNVPLQFRVLVMANLSPSSVLMSMMSFLRANSYPGEIGSSMMSMSSISYILTLLEIWLCLIATFFKQATMFSSILHDRIGTKRSSIPHKSLSNWGSMILSALQTEHGRTDGFNMNCHIFGLFRERTLNFKSFAALL